MTEAITVMCPTALAPLLAQVAPGVPQVGEYMSILKIIGMLVLVVPWLLVAPWVHKDSEFVRAPGGLWGSVILGAGGVSFLIWLLLPYYFAGMLVYLLVTSTVVLSYVAYRNGRVKNEDQKIGLNSLFKKQQQKRQQVDVVTRLQIYGANGQTVTAPSSEAQDANEARAYNAVQELLYDIVWRRASEADMSSAGDQARVRLVIDGMVVDRAPRSVGESEMIVQYLKRIGGMDVEERRRPQKGRISVDLAGSQVDIVLTTAGTTSGQRMQFKVVQEFVQTRLEDLGISADLLSRIRELTTGNPGLFIVSGPPKSGVTSTLYSLLREQDAFIRELVTLEAEVQVDLENVTQIAYGSPAELPRQLASLLRRDPDVVMLDTCGDAETAELIRENSSQKLFLLGMRAKDSFSGLAKWAKLCGSAAAAVENLRGVLCQMLLRRLCPKCKAPYKPDSQLLAKANIPPGSVEVFFRPRGKLTNEKGEPYMCPTCQGTGYFGRTAAFELLEMTDDLKQQIVTGVSLSKIKAAARKNKMLYLQEQSLRKVIAGETAIQEVIRVSQRKK